jgi:glycosyltransferase involved in cell wall biosynthesis
VDPARIAAARAAVGVPPGAPYILQVARLQHFKGQDLLVEAASKLRTRFPHVHTVMVGATLFGLEENFPDHVRARIDATSMTDRIHLPGGVDDATLEALLEGAEGLCYAERRGPWSLVILEAMARGKPVVASRTAGSQAALIDGLTGRLVAADDADALGRGLEELLEDQERSRAWGRAGRSRWTEAFTVETSVAQVQQLYDEMLGPGRILPDNGRR